MDISELDGSYVFLGTPLMSTYVVFVGPESAMMYGVPDRPLTDSIPAPEPIALVPPPPAAGPDVPPELAAAFYVGTWPLPPGTYDPALDDAAIPAGARLFGLFDADFIVLPPPDAITGFTAVTDMSQLTEGSFYTFIAASGFGYVALGTANMAAPAPVAPAPDPAPAAPAAMLPGDMSAYWFPGTDVQIGMRGYQELYFDFDLEAAGFGTGNVFAIFFEDDGEIAFSQGVTLTTFDADFNPITTIISPGERVLVSTVNGYNFALGNTGNSLAFILASSPGIFAGLTPASVLADLVMDAPPDPLEFTVTLRERSDVQITLFDANERYGYFFFDLTDRPQRVYMFRLRGEGAVTFSSNVTIHFPNSITGVIEDHRTMQVAAGNAVPIAQLHGGHWYLGDGFDSNYVLFIDDTSIVPVLIPERFLNPADLSASMTAFRAVAILELYDGRLRPYSVLGGEEGRPTLIVLLGGIAIAVPLGIVIFISHRRELRTGGAKFTQAEIRTE
jgi:hypothetical protein